METGALAADKGTSPIVTMAKGPLHVEPAPLGESVAVRVPVGMSLIQKSVLAHVGNVSTCGHCKMLFRTVKLLLIIPK